MSTHPDVLALIPHRPPFLFVDEIVAAEGDRLTARRTFRAEEDFFKGHYPGAPITPGVILCEAVFQTGALLLARQALAAGARLGDGMPLMAKVTDARFRSSVFPGDTVTIEVVKRETIGGFTLLSGRMKNGERRVLSVDFAVAWRAPEDQT